MSLKVYILFSRFFFTAKLIQKSSDLCACVASVRVSVFLGYHRLATALLPLHHHNPRIPLHHRVQSILGC